MDPKAAQYPIEKAEALLAKLRVEDRLGTDLQLLRTEQERLNTLRSRWDHAFNTLWFAFLILTVSPITAAMQPWQFKVCILSTLLVQVFMAWRIRRLSTRIADLNAIRALFESVAPQKLEEVTRVLAKQPDLIAHPASLSVDP